MDINNFKWGIMDKNEWMKYMVCDEVFDQNLYQKFVSVDEGDVVVDVGASVGPFACSIASRNPKVIYCIEPHMGLFETLVENTKNLNAICFNKAIGSIDGEESTRGLFNAGLSYPHDEFNLWNVYTMKFSSFLEATGIDHIDFLKTDCEGGEYDIFNEENFDWIVAHVKKISGEWHLNNDGLKAKFRQFRDKYLNEFTDFEVHALDGTDIKPFLWTEWFLSYYGIIHIHIDNRVRSHTALDVEGFDWGILNETKTVRDSIYQDVFVKDVYQRHFRVEEGDVVVDLGASVGPFAFSLALQNPKQIYCIEPHIALFETLANNLTNFRAVCINKAIGYSDGLELQNGIYNHDLVHFSHEETNQQPVYAVRFDTLCKAMNIRRIDFLKTDCEGGEYAVFTDENLTWIRKNVKKIAGEWHTDTEELKEKFKHFRDTYLKVLPNFRVYTPTNDDITDTIWDDGVIDFYAYVMVYIDNQIPKGKPWGYSIAPTLEFTTVVPKTGCVVDCVFCPQKVFTDAYKGERTMTLENFKKVVDKIPSEIRLTLSGFMEPWLNKQATDMLLYAYESGHEVSVFTTGVGMTLDDVERIQHILYSWGPNGGFLLHLPDKDGLAKHPITNTYIKVLEYMKEAFAHIPNFKTMAMGEVHPAVAHIFPDVPIYQMFSRSGNLFKESLMKPDLFNQTFNKVYHGEIDVTCNCQERLYHNIMMPNGDVYLCCMDWSLEFKLGNLYEQEYEDVIPKPYSCYKICRYCENGIDVNHPSLQEEITLYKRNQGESNGKPS